MPQRLVRFPAGARRASAPPGSAHQGPPPVGLCSMRTFSVVFAEPGPGANLAPDASSRPSRPRPRRLSLGSGRPQALGIKKCPDPFSIVSGPPWVTPGSCEGPRGLGRGFEDVCRSHTEGRLCPSHPSDYSIDFVVSTYGLEQDGFMVRSLHELEDDSHIIPRAAGPGV